MNAIIKEGRWVSTNGEPLSTIELRQVHDQISRIHNFTEGLVELTHDKIQILSKILYATPLQEQAILKILSTLTEEEINSLI